MRSDHRALRWLFSLKSPTGRIARWIEILSGYTFQVEYRQGQKHGNANALSRCPNPKDCNCQDIDTEEMLKCGPCFKCRKRALEMDSNIHDISSQNVCTNKIYNEPLKTCSVTDSKVNDIHVVNESMSNVKVTNTGTNIESTKSDDSLLL